MVSQAYHPSVLKSFESIDALTSIVFPKIELEYEEDQALLVPSEQLTGAHYSYDVLGSGKAIKQSAIERIRFTVAEDDPDLLDAAVQSIKSKLFEIGRGKLRKSLNQDTVQRWCYARAVAMPTLAVRNRDSSYQSVRIDFRRDSDWFSSALVTTNLSPNADPYNVDVTNAGDATAYAIAVIFKGTFTNPNIRNNTLINGKSLIASSLRDGTNAAHWLRFNAANGKIEWSTNSGSSYSDDIVNWVRASGQVHLFALAPGVNALTIRGANGATVTLEYYSPWH